MVNKLDEFLAFHATALNLRAYRQQLLASNMANADTPNYKARDIDFTAALKGAMDERGGVKLTTTSGRHIATGQQETIPGVPVAYRTVVQPSIDGNTVDMNVERGEFADNAVRYEASLTFLSGQMKALLAAIQG